MGREVNRLLSLMGREVDRFLPLTGRKSISSSSEGKKSIGSSA
jgi:hypothetical protein